MADALAAKDSGWRVKFPSGGISHWQHQPSAGNHLAADIALGTRIESQQYHRHEQEEKLNVSEAVAENEIENDYVRLLFDRKLMSEIEHFAEKHDRSSTEIILLGLRLFKMLDQLKDEEQNLAIVKKGSIVKKIVLT